jgi:hypothetical protein
MVAENVENGNGIEKPTISLYIMDVHITESSYILVGPYWIQTLLTGSLLNQKTIYNCVLHGPIV